jgi:hypothetical protein
MYSLTFRAIGRRSRKKTFFLSATVAPLTSRQEDLLMSPHALERCEQVRYPARLGP